MFPHRSNWNGYEPASAWFFVAGYWAERLDRLAVAAPLIIQTRGVDTLEALRSSPWRASTFGGVIEVLARQPPGGLPEAWLTALRADAQSHSVSPESLRAVVFAAWLFPRGPIGQAAPVDPDSVTLPVDSILPSYGADPFQVSYAAPSALLSVVPYRATWLGSPSAIAVGTRGGRAIGQAARLFAIPPVGLIGRMLGRIA